MTVGGARRARAAAVSMVQHEPDEAEVTITVSDDGGIGIHFASDDDADQDPGNFDDNLAERIDDGALNSLAAHLLEGINADIESRAGWLETVDLAAYYLGIKLEDPSSSTSTDGTIAKSIATCLLEAVVKSWSTARAELLPVGGPVKVRRDDLPTTVAPPGDTPAPGQPAPPAGIGHNGGPPMDMDKLSNALEQDMNWYLTVGDREYYPDFSKMLFSRALIGNAFRKVYRCPIKRKPRSVWVQAQNLIISNDCTHISGAGRITEIISMRQAVMRRMQSLGVYRDVALAQPTGEATESEEKIADLEGIAATPSLPADFEHKLYETLVDLSSDAMPGLELLDKDENGKKPGWPLSYRVTLDKDSQTVLEIRRAWKRGDPDYERRKRYVKYGFVPGLGFYDSGLIHLAGNATQAATMLERSTIDTALFNNFPGGLYAQGPTTREEQTVWRPGPGEFIGVKTPAGMKITDMVMPLPYKPPSAECLALMDKMEARVRSIAGVIDLPVGEGRIGNTPVGTIMSYVEAVSQVPGAVHKDDFVSQAEEFEILRELLAEDMECLTRGNKTPARRWEIVEELMAPDLIPAADPNTPSVVHRLMKLQAIITASGLPQFQGIADQRAIWAKLMELMGTNEGDCTMPEQAQAPPPPDPKVIAAQIKAQSTTDQINANMQRDQLDHTQKMAELAQEGTERDADRQSAETRAAMALEAAQVKTRHDAAQGDADRAAAAADAAADRTHDTVNAAADRTQRHVQHMTGLAADAAMQTQQQQADAAQGGLAGGDGT